MYTIKMFLIMDQISLIFCVLMFYHINIVIFSRLIF